MLQRRSGQRLLRTPSTWTMLMARRGQQTAFLHGTSFGHRVSNLLQRGRKVRWQSSKPTPNPTEHLGSPAPQSLSARMRKLSREYGWAGLGVYLGLSALDFPFCFLGVRWLGTERIGRWEAVVIETFWKGVESVYPEARQSVHNTIKDTGLSDGEREGAGWGVEEADARNKSDSASELSRKRQGGRLTLT